MQLFIAIVCQHKNKLKNACEQNLLIPSISSQSEDICWPTGHLLSRPSRYVSRSASSGINTLDAFKKTLPENQTDAL